MGIDGSRQRNSRMTLFSLGSFSSETEKRRSSFLSANAPGDPTGRNTIPRFFVFFCLVQWAALPNSQPEIQANATKKLELSMRNREAREEAPSRGPAPASSVPPPPLGRRDLDPPLS